MQEKNQVCQDGASCQTRPVVRKAGERGFSLMLIAVCLFVMISMLGLAFDLGRMFIQKAELQTFADASALAALSEMNGTQVGIQGANATATAGPLGTTKPNGYNFDTQDITDVTATYASTFLGTYDSYATASAPATNTYRFIKVVATASLPLDFMPVLPGIASSISLTASAIAGQKVNSTPGSLDPFMPDAHNVADKTNFGLTPGVEYTLKWGTGNPGTTTCAGDLSFVDPNPQAQHGFVNLGQGNSNSATVGAIVFGANPTSSLDVADLLAGVPGNRGTTIFDALNTRASQDVNDTSTTYADYQASYDAGTANGRRVITVAIGDPSTWNGNGNGSEAIAGFGNFLLDTTYAGTDGPICATYIGPADPNGIGTGGTDGTVAYYNMLFQ